MSEANINSIVDEYVEFYELRDGDHADYQPKDWEKFLIKDAIFGLIEERDFIQALQPKPPSDPQREGETPETDEFILYSVRTDHNWREHARKLERQRNEARAKLTAAREALEMLLKDSEYRTRERCRNHGEEYGLGTEEEQLARKTLTQLNDHE